MTTSKPTGSDFRGLFLSASQKQKNNIKNHMQTHRNAITFFI